MSKNMVSVTIDGRTVEVEAGSNLVDASLKAGVQIPHYCYHPKLSVVGQCRMCLVKIEGMPNLQTGCTTQIMKDGMEVRIDDDEVRAAQEGMMEFLLINHPLDCPICDQAGECGLQDYSFKHGQAFSRFSYEDKRTYPGKERIPLGPNVVLNMNRCIQCTRCVRFTEEISGTGELGFFQRGSRAEIGVFPGNELDNPLSTCVVDICPVGALTSTQFRFAERVWYLDKKPSLCTGCDAGCNITLEHRRGKIQRYKPRANDEVNDHWMCDFGRTTFQAYDEPRLSTPKRRNGRGEIRTITWDEALTSIHHSLAHGAAMGTVGILARGAATTEEAYLLKLLADSLETPHRGGLREPGPERLIPTSNGGLVGSEITPNRRGAELAGLEAPSSAERTAKMLAGAVNGAHSALLLFDGGRAGLDNALRSPAALEGLRKAETIVVVGWATTELTEIADIVLPIATHAETEGTLVNSQNRIQKFERAFPPPAGVRTGVEALVDLLRKFRPDFAPKTVADVFGLMATELSALEDVSLTELPASGIQLPVRPQ
ncbi:MAG: molybdopterin-dependent oxidoreductase [bacterium]|nr:molybdopterin-dependent oxidoreductase [bacterium]